MSDEGEKTCPLCAEEMDLTDQQLKPCKCGYEICVWCWHHIMNMAEKDETEGRCPACRTPYNKEKIVGLAANTQRMVAEISLDKKGKSHKAKSKTSEGRKQLSSVRVIQRNLVYVVGLPLNLADEDLLQRKEYFGQYGKVLKVSISRTAAGAIQHFANSTCSVYITYLKEDEAVRCIQSVHGFHLEGRSLRACFGTTKYCHAWLKSIPCSNPDCLYLHEIGTQEDSFTKDEIISAYTRVQQITGASNDMQSRSGNMLPPPVDEYNCNNGSVSSADTIISKTPSNNLASSVRVSSPPSSCGRPVALPAAASWGTRAANGQLSNGSITCSNGPCKTKPDTSSSGSLAFSTAVVNPTQVSAGKKLNEGKRLNEETCPTRRKGKLETLGSIKKPALDYRGTTADSSIMNAQISTTVSMDQDKSIDSDVTAKEKIKVFCSNISSLNISEPLDQVAEVGNLESNEDLSTFDDQRLEDTEVSLLPNLCQSDDLPNSSSIYSKVVDKKPDKILLPPSLSNGYLDDRIAGSSHWDNGFQYSYSPLNEGKRNNSSLDMGESSIISNILSLDSDSWEESLTSPQNIAKLLGETDNKEQVPLRGSNSWKGQNNNTQSRFSFAREGMHQVSDAEQSPSNIGQAFMSRPFDQDFVNNGDFYLSKFGNSNGFSFFGFEGSENFATGHSSVYTSKLSGSRSQISAPPGFSVPSRAPPPGFSAHERLEQTSLDSLQGNHMLDSSFLRTQHQASSAYTNTAADLEFMDPAILAVGKGRLASTFNNSSFDKRSSNYPQLNSFENDQRLRLLMQTTLSSHHRYVSEMGDTYGIPSRILDQSLTNNNLSSPYSQLSRNSGLPNGHWDHMQNGNDLRASEFPRNERLGVNKYNYGGGGYEDTKYRMPGSSDLYNRPYGI